MKRFCAVTIRQIADPAIREYSCQNIVFSKDLGEFFVIPLDAETLKSQGYRNLSDVGKKLLNGLNHIGGIKRIYIGKNDITVTIANGYHWGFIQADIIHSFEHVFGRVKVYEEYRLDM